MLYTNITNIDIVYTNITNINILYTNITNITNITINTNYLNFKRNLKKRCVYFFGYLINFQKFQSSEIINKPCRKIPRFSRTYSMYDREASLRVQAKVRLTSTK